MSLSFDTWNDVWYEKNENVFVPVRLFKLLPNPQPNSYPVTAVIETGDGSLKAVPVCQIRISHPAGESDE